MRKVLLRITGISLVVEVMHLINTSVVPKPYVVWFGGYVGGGGIAGNVDMPNGRFELVNLDPPMPEYVVLTGEVSNHGSELTIRSKTNVIYRTVALLLASLGILVWGVLLIFSMKYELNMSAFVQWFGMAFAVLIMTVHWINTIVASFIFRKKMLHIVAIAERKMQHRNSNSTFPDPK